MSYIIVLPHRSKRPTRIIIGFYFSCPISRQALDTIEIMGKRQWCAKTCLAMHTVAPGNIHVDSFDEWGEGCPKFLAEFTEEGDRTKKIPGKDLTNPQGKLVEFGASLPTI